MKTQTAMLPSFTPKLDFDINIREWREKLKLEEYLEEETKIANAAKRLASEYLSSTDLERRVDVAASLTMLVLAGLTGDSSLISKALRLARRRG